MRDLDDHEKLSRAAGSSLNDHKNLCSLFREEDHVPNSDDFIVYLVKKNHKMKV